MGFKCGIIGLPNVGKSTIFNILAQTNVAVANYPFCTINPNIGIVPVFDHRLEKIAKIVNSKKCIYTAVEFVDIAGLVKGASQGEGLGNKFLSNIRETQAIAHVVRCFDNNTITHVAGNINPEFDVEIVNMELILADLDTVQKVYSKLTKNYKINSNNKKDDFDIFILKLIQDSLNNGIKIYNSGIDYLNSDLVKQLNLLTAKPTFYIANVDEKEISNNEYYKKIELIANNEKAPLISICAAIESEILLLDVNDRTEFLKDLGIKESSLNNVIFTGYNLLGLQTFFTAGPKEVKAWTIRKGTKALQAAKNIHCDFERGFICVEVISYSDYITYNGENGAKEAGKLRIEGKDYVMQDGDIIHFRFNV